MFASAFTPFLHFVTIENAKIHYFDYHPAKNKNETSRPLPTVVFIHGACSNLFNWQFQLKFLMEKNLPYRIIAIDLPGHGKSEKIEPLNLEMPTIDYYTDFLKKFFRRVEIQGDIILVGHSMGGAISLKYSLTSDVKPIKLILVGTGLKLPVSPKLLQLLHSNHLEALKKVLKWSFLKPQEPDPLKELRQEAGKIFLNTEKDIAVYDFEACARYSVEDRCREISIPTLIIVGKDDVMTPVSLNEEIAQCLPNVKNIIKIPKAGHLVMLEQKDTFNRELLKVLESN